ncbi:hypothetical protein PG994_007255 [Apiospora phragmitis]|uniref:Protein kinase domain-containing protein n=1 Tax=Apiospora phragmitis TaxID=2905665 RepID=A0ABR1V0C7_9PEZI
MRGGGGGRVDSNGKPWWYDILHEDDDDTMKDEDSSNEEEEEEEEEAAAAERDLQLQDHPVPVYSLYFQHSNSGTLAALRDTYRAQRRRIPEHFVWHVAQQLCAVLVHLHCGERGPSDSEGSDDSDSDSGDDTNTGNDSDSDWDLGNSGSGSGEREQVRRRTVYHRELFARNVAVHYRSHKSGPKPRGECTNAFPGIRLGGFGRAFVEGDPVSIVRPRAWDGDAEDAHPEEWEDVAGLGTILRELATTHIIGPGGSDNDVNRIRVACANRDCSVRHSDGSRAPRNEEPYSDELIAVLQKF